MTTQRETYEIVLTAEGETFVYRSIVAGICGPMAVSAATDRIDAEADALRYGIIRDGDWTVSANGTHYAPATKAA